MVSGIPRLPVAVLAALSILASGCAQRVCFEAPAGATVLLDGRRLGTIPFEAGLDRGRALPLEVRPSAKLLASLERPARAQGVRGQLVLPRSAREVVFEMDPGQLRLALETDMPVTVNHGGAYKRVLYFKGSAAGIPADDPDVLAELPPAKSKFAEAAESVGEGITRGSQILLVVGLIALAVWGASR